VTSGEARNPFGRVADKGRDLHKSESFFDKVEAAESGKGKSAS
jgi:chromosome transmission fidelity protein 4